MSDNLVGGTKLAEILGVKPQAISNAVSSGRLSVERQGPRGNLFDVEVAVAEWTSTAAVADMQDGAKYLPRGLKGGRPAGKRNYSGDDDEDGSHQGTYLKAKAANEAIKARLAQLKLEEKNGSLVAKEDVKKDGEELGAILLGTLQSWPARLAPELSSMKNADEHDFHVFLATQINELIITIRSKCGVLE